MSTANGIASVKRRENKPPRMEIQGKNLPPELLHLDRWLGWRWEYDAQRRKWDKPPVCIRTGRSGSSTNEKTWCDFSTAGAAVEAEEVDGAGIALGPLGDGRNLCGVDFDNCRDPATGQLDPTVAELMQLVGAYLEVSPSGEGVKGLCFGTLPKGRRTFELHGAANVELYDSGRYFTVTGHRLEIGAESLSDCTDRLRKFHEALDSNRTPQNETDLSDSELAVQALSALHPARADNYADWIAVGMAMRSVDDSLHDEWDRWSRQSDKYASGVCAAKWNSFSGSGLGLGSLIHWAREDGWTPPRRKPAQRQLSDLGNAERLFNRFGDRIRHIGTWNRFLVYDGQRWRSDETGEVQRLAQSTVRNIFDEAKNEPDDKQRKAIASWALTNEKRDRLAAMIALAATQSGVAVRHDCFDTHPYRLNCKNGTVNLRSGDLAPHNPDDLLTKTTGVEYPAEPGVEAPLWSQFLESIFAGDVSLVEFVKRLMGAALIGEQIEHLLPIFWGLAPMDSQYSLLPY